MTVPSFGRVMPIHLVMLHLAGYVEDGGDMRPSKTDEELLRALRVGRRALIESTGEDFGFDLEVWREFLMSAPDDEFGYRHPYAFGSVDEAIQRAIRNERRIRLVATLKE